MVWKEGRIEQIGVVFGVFSKKDVLYISNRKPNLWIFSLFNGYKQIGVFRIEQPHNFKEGEDVLVNQDILTGDILEVKKGEL